MLASRFITDSNLSFLPLPSTVGKSDFLFPVRFLSICCWTFVTVQRCETVLSFRGFHTSPKKPHGSMSNKEEPLADEMAAKAS